MGRKTQVMAKPLREEARREGVLLLLAADLPEAEWSVWLSVAVQALPLDRRMELRAWLIRVLREMDSG
jgi:hypothetical protein